MPTTMKLIGKQTLGSAAASVTFSSIPSTYTDLLITYSARSIRSGQRADNINIRFNGSSATNYSYRYLEGNGSTVGSFNGSAQAQLIVGYSTAATATASTFASGEIYIPNYAGSTAKSVSSTSVTEHNGGTSGDAFILAFAGLWSLTDAITSVEVISQVANFAADSSFYLYAISRA
jgi:hypothetical protein